MTQSHDADRRADAPAQERDEERAEQRRADAQREPQVDEETSQQQSEGQASEVQNLGNGEPISDSQSVAGQPDGESGQVDEGPTGPNSRAGSERN